MGKEKGNNHPAAKMCAIICKAKKKYIQINNHLVGQAMQQQTAVEAESVWALGFGQAAGQQGRR